MLDMEDCKSGTSELSTCLSLARGLRRLRELQKHEDREFADAGLVW